MLQLGGASCCTKMFPQFFILILYQFVICSTRSHRDSINSFQLQVPGSHPITIIDAEERPLWDSPSVSRRRYTTEPSRSNLEHRGVYGVRYSTERPIAVEISRPYGNFDYEDTETTTENSGGKLSDFLNKYSNLKKRPANPTHDRFDRIELITKPPEVESEKVTDKSKSWNLLDVRRHQYPYEDKKGWVSMEAIPWSVSKVAKWQSNIVKQTNKYEEKDTEYDRLWMQQPEERPSYFSPKPSATQFSNQYNQYNQNKPVSTGTHSHKIHVEKPNSMEDQRRPWYTNKNPENCDDNPEIITDSRPANFPSTSHGYHRRQGSMNEEPHPSSHPFNGDGEWILLSTTKGFKYPKSRRRSLQLETDSVNTPDSISTHKSVRLTVLPPLKNSKVNMTTSHGGLLQVESTFQSVDEAQKNHVKQKYKRRPQIRPNKIISLNKLQQTSPSPQTHNGPDASTVLAAVGAGMIPATMAMLVPLAMNGRRRRSIPTNPTLPYPTLHDLQIQLPHFN